MWCIFNTEQCFILKVLTGNYVSISGSRALSLSSSFPADQETSAPLGETAQDFMVENRFIVLPFSRDRLYD